jgi:hypothetical protein
VVEVVLHPGLGRGVGDLAVGVVLARRQVVLCGRQRGDGQQHDGEHRDDHRDHREAALVAP